MYFWLKCLLQQYYEFRDIKFICMLNTEYVIYSNFFTNQNLNKTMLFKNLVICLA